MTHPSLADHPFLALYWLSIIGLKAGLLTKPLPIPLLLWAVVSLVRSVLMFSFTALWWTHAWSYVRYQGSLVEDFTVVLCALWCYLMMFTPRREDMKHIWIPQFLLFGGAGLLCMVIANGRQVTNLQPIEVVVWGSTLLIAGVFWIISVFGEWANGHEQDQQARDARVMVIGFLVMYTMDACADGFATWAARTMGARVPLWLVGMTATFGVLCYWMRAFKKRPSVI